MKTLKLFTSTFLSFVIISFVNAQNPMQESHQKLTDIHASITKKHEELNSGAVKDFKKFSNELGVLLENAKQQLIVIEKKQTPKQKEAVKTYLDAMKKNHGSAMNHYNAIKAEAAKAKPDQNKIKASSKLMISQLKEAEKQNQEMSKKATVK